MLRPFITDLRKHIAAVQAALDLPWTNSPIEGQISRLKMFKQTMYGRAGFTLLRARVLQPNDSPTCTMFAAEPEYGRH